MTTTILNSKKAMANENVTVQEPKKASWIKRNLKWILGGAALVGATVLISNKDARTATIAAGKKAWEGTKNLVNKVKGNKTQVNDQAIPASEPVQAREYDNNRNREYNNRNWNNQQRTPRFNN